MYQLIVDAADVVTVTDHEDRDEAYGQLVRHVVRGDYYLRTIRSGAAHTTFELLTLVAERRRPRSAGHAIIAEVSVGRALPAAPLERAAIAAGGLAEVSSSPGTSAPSTLESSEPSHGAV